ncbi:UNVERIFIED_CONTAM: hypothetical protein Slati_1430900 [Sesamum latifolium]|uniref:RNase H type-1 domain-containing protein n=1 Tax=Sesamum latifolium TaxID=2727402 RepID=A0AAW2X5N3_9LAMI
MDLLPRKGSGAGTFITSPRGEDLEFAVKFNFKASNNEAEYEALVAGMKMAHEAGARHLLAYSDSQLVVKQVEEVHISSPPQSNGQVEVTNRILVQEIKRRLERVGRNWTEELTSVLWAYRTTPRGSTGESPFILVYGTEAIIPAELGIPSHRIMHFSEDHNNELLKENLDLLEELSEKAFIRIQRYKNIMTNAYNRKVKTRSFQVEDLVLRRTNALKPVGKLDPTWEGPYKVTTVIGRGVYRLEDLEGRLYPIPGMFIISKNTMSKNIHA